MDSDQTIYKCFSEATLSSFFEFLSNLQKNNLQLDEFFMTRLRAIHEVLQKLIDKNDVNKRVKPVRNGVPISKTAADVKPAPAEQHEKKRKTTDCDESINWEVPTRLDEQTVVDKLSKFIERDVEGSDESDCEMGTESDNPESLFKTDYPYHHSMLDDTLNSSKNSICSDADSSVNKIPLQNVSSLPSTPTEKSNVSINTERDPYIEKVNDDVFMCKLCSIHNLPRNNVHPHINGKQHRNLLKLPKTSVDKAEEDIGSVLQGVDKSLYLNKDDGSSFIVLGSYECLLCKIKMNSQENLLQHLKGSKHIRKLI